MDKKQLIYPGQTVCVLGLGVTGRAAVRYCLSKGAKVSVSDVRPEERFLQEEASFLKENEVEWEAGAHTYDFLIKNKLLLPSPGIDLRTALFNSLLESGVCIAGELAVMAGQIEAPVVAVTGTNGKTTVTSLIGEVLRGSGKRVFVGGNIGTPLYEYCLADGHYDAVVVEVSSFQLECSGDFAPDIAILLNITPDHIDRHGTMDGYIKAKGQIFAHQNVEGLAIINNDDLYCQKITIPEGVKIENFGRSGGCFLEISESKFSLASAESGREDVSISLNGLDGFSSYNYASAFLALRRLGLSVLEIESGFQQFKDLPHRLEFVAEIGGVSFVNDSKATNTGALIGALGKMKTRVVLIAGGRGKGDDYRLLRQSVKEKVDAVVLIGESADEIQTGLGDIVACSRALTMEDAVVEAYRKARSGDTVLLSPACASFDMFNSYGHRGNVFKAAVMALEAQKRMERGDALVQ